MYTFTIASTGVPHNSHTMELQKGDTLSLQEKQSTISISWKQGSFFGVGGDRTQIYTLCTYTLSSGANVPVYIQKGYDIPARLKIDSNLQCGMQEGERFFVYHDKSQRPYQHRFRCNSQQQGFDLSWIVGDYLQDIN